MHSRIEVNLGGGAYASVSPDGALIDGAWYPLEQAERLDDVARAARLMREIHVSKTAPEHPSSGVGAGRTVEHGRPLGGGCSDRCSSGCKLPSSPLSCGHCEPAPVVRDDVPSVFCRTCWYTGSECDCQDCRV